MELKNILITGIAGFIGSRLAEHITSNFQDCKIVGVDNLHSGKFKNLSKKEDNLFTMPISFEFRK